MDTFRRIIDDTAADPTTAGNMVDDAVRLSLRAREGQDEPAAWRATGTREASCAGLEAMGGTAAGMPVPDPAAIVAPPASSAPVTLW